MSSALNLTVRYLSSQVINCGDLGSLKFVYCHLKTFQKWQKQLYSGDWHDPIVSTVKKHVKALIQ